MRQLRSPPHIVPFHTDPVIHQPIHPQDATSSGSSRQRSSRSSRKQPCLLQPPRRRRSAFRFRMRGGDRHIGCGRLFRSLTNCSIPHRSISSISSSSLGNQAFKAGDFRKAIQHYTEVSFVSLSSCMDMDRGREAASSVVRLAPLTLMAPTLTRQAIEIDPNNHTYWSNRRYVRRCLSGRSPVATRCHQGMRNRPPLRHINPMTPAQRLVRGAAGLGECRQRRRGVRQGEQAYRHEWRPILDTQALNPATCCLILPPPPSPPPSPPPR